MIDLKSVQKNLTSEKVIELVTELGSDAYVEKSDHIQFKTICHNIDTEDASMKLYYYKKNNMFHCYTSCGDTFNIYELFKRRYELLGTPYSFYQDIVLRIAGDQERFNLNPTKYVSDMEKYKKQITDVNIPIINPNILNIFVFHPTPEWLSDGISEESMREYNILYSIGQNKIIIPHYNINGDLIGIRGRALNAEDLALGKYMPVTIEGKIYSHPLGYNVYGLDRVKENIKNMKFAIVAESEKSALQYYTMFGKDRNVCVAACGSTFHAYQLDLLIRAGAEKILIAFDKEGENWKEQDKYYLKLKGLCERYKSRCKMGFIFDTHNLLNLKDSPFDRGKETFLNLYKNSKWI